MGKATLNLGHTGLEYYVEDLRNSEPDGWTFGTLEEAQNLEDAVGNGSVVIYVRRVTKWKVLK